MQKLMFVQENYAAWAKHKIEMYKPYVQIQFVRYFHILSQAKP